MRVQLCSARGAVYWVMCVLDTANARTACSAVGETLLRSRSTKV